ncbi:hypothetical protein SDC9_85726 [bioreactor metagenome]|uniref:Uncharacterized protein n=1 Tax=bioreactor metagenome TaxID=1076179 RepID=A0A644ZMY0_9ZZZZ
MPTWSLPFLSSTLDVNSESTAVEISSTAVNFVDANAVMGTIATVIIAAINKANFFFILFPPYKFFGLIYPFKMNQLQRLNVKLNTKLKST